MGSTYKNRSFKIDLGETHRRGACEKHKRSGFTTECEDCMQAPFEKVAVPELQGFFVEILNPRVLPYGQKRELYREPDDDSEAAKQARLARIVKGLVVSWNLVAADDTSDQPRQLPLPSEDDNSLDRAPDIIGAVFAELARRAEEPVVPKPSATA